jgi:hypothetical protein
MTDIGEEVGVTNGGEVVGAVDVREGVRGGDLI